jgi:exopolysaccharide biosynthesis protein
LLVDRGRLAFDPAADAFDPGAIQLTKVTYQAAVAWTRQGGLWFLVSEKTTAKRLAEGLAALPEVWGALRLDSGGSAQLWVKGELVYPSRARKVVNGLALYPR